MNRSARLHAVLTALWLALAVPSILLWRSSITWLVFMSVYAIVATHWDCYQTAKANDE